jgi:hypothetical protein
MMARASEYFNQQDPLTDGFRHPELYVLDSLAEELAKIRRLTQRFVAPEPATRVLRVVRLLEGDSGG